MLQSDKNTDFVTQLGKWISAVLEPFEVKFARNVEKLFPSRSSLFQVIIIFYRFEVIVKNLSQPLKFGAIFGCFLLFSPRDGVRRILKLPDYSNYTGIHNSWKFCENRSSSFWERTVNKKKNKQKQNIIGHRCYARVPIIKPRWYRLLFSIPWKLSWNMTVVVLYSNSVIVQFCAYCYKYCKPPVTQSQSMMG